MIFSYLEDDDFLKLLEDLADQINSYMMTKTWYEIHIKNGNTYSGTPLDKRAEDLHNTLWLTNVYLNKLKNK